MEWRDGNRLQYTRGRSIHPTRIPAGLEAAVRTGSRLIETSSASFDVGPWLDVSTFLLPVAGTFDCAASCDFPNAVRPQLVVGRFARFAMALARQENEGQENDLAVECLAVVCRGFATLDFWFSCPLSSCRLENLQTPSAGCTPRAKLTKKDSN